MKITKMKIVKFNHFLLFGVLLFSACDKNGNLNFLSVEDDKKLGLQVSQQIAASPTEYPLLSESANPGAYTYLRNLRDKLINNGKLSYRNEFAWEVYIIKDDNTLNAFCTPGGYIYVYTGLIKYLDNEDQLAGVLGHEIAHADLRHTSRQITKEQGYETVIQAITGQSPGTIATIALQLKTLQNSRAYETEADAKSVEYLAPTNYACNGAAGFFEKMIANGSAPSQPQWLSTHPNPDNRVQAINTKADQLGCSKSPLSPASYADFKASLP
jgi:predicted Zn-dependent protease